MRAGAMAAASALEWILNATLGGIAARSTRADCPCLCETGRDFPDALLPVSLFGGGGGGKTEGIFSIMMLRGCTCTTNWRICVEKNRKEESLREGMKGSSFLNFTKFSESCPFIQLMKFNYIRHVENYARKDNQTWMLKISIYIRKIREAFQLFQRDKFDPLFIFNFINCFTAV